MAETGDCHDWNAFVNGVRKWRDTLTLAGNRESEACLGGAVGESQGTTVAGRPSIEVKDLFKREHVVIDCAVAQGLEELSHLRLPAGVDGVGFHGGGAFGEVVGFKIADEEAVWLEKEGVIAPACFLEGSEHLRPNVRMTLFVLLHMILADLEKKADSHFVLFVFETFSLKQAK